MNRRFLRGGLLIGLVVLVGSQFVGPSPSNPAVDASLRLEAHATLPVAVADTLRRACYDCHSNETKWPWYSNVAPMRWLVVKDVDEGRGQVNFSRWADYNAFDRADMLDEACTLARSGKMPLRPYLLVHGEARLSPGDIDALCAWTRDEAERLAGGAAPE